MSVKVRMSPGMLRQLAKASSQVLADLAPVTRAHAQSTLSVAQARVPRDSGGLAQSAFTDGPEKRTEKSASSTSGYDHHAAGAIHEGFHFGVKTQRPEPHWLRKAARAARNPFRKACASQVSKTLSRLFGK